MRQLLTRSLATDRICMAYVEWDLNRVSTVAISWPWRLPRFPPSPTEAGSNPRCHLWVTWGVYLCAGKPPLADIILSHPPDLT